MCGLTLTSVEILWLAQVGVCKALVSDVLWMAQVGVCKTGMRYVVWMAHVGGCKPGGWGLGCVVD